MCHVISYSHKQHMTRLCLSGNLWVPHLALSTPYWVTYAVGHLCTKSFWFTLLFFPFQCLLMLSVFSFFWCKWDVSSISSMLVCSSHWSCCSFLGLSISVSCMLILPDYFYCLFVALTDCNDVCRHWILGLYWGPCWQSCLSSSTTLHSTLWYTAHHLESHHPVFLTHIGSFR